MQIVALALLVHGVRKASPARAALQGWIFGTVWLTSSLWWVFISMHTYGGMPTGVAALATASLGAGLATYYAVAAASWAWARSRIHMPSLAFASLWLLAELARGTLLTGFPWAAGGYAHTSGPLKYWAPWIGVYGIAMLSAWVAAALARAWELGFSQRALAVRALLSPLVVLLVGTGLPQDFTDGSGRLSVTLLQPNIAQQEKFTKAGVERVLGWHLEALMKSRGALVVTPESSIPVPASELPPAIQRGLFAPLAAGGRAALLGVFIGDTRVGFSNGLVGLSDRNGLVDPRAYRYAKRHLLPFGEYTPPGFEWLIAMMDIPLAQQVPGKTTAILDVANQRARPLICYEDLFGEDFVDSVVGEQAATVLVNASNLAWFGRWRPKEFEFSQAQHQHLEIGRMRALEFQRPFVRAGNSGITAAIDHRGNLVQMLAPSTEGVLETAVEGREGDTPYARWLRLFGLWPLFVASTYVLTVGYLVRHTKRS